tara:strand:- start:162 stop:566 length:405 start_codon:yes stop_codon:yes gene_type:complete
MKNQSFEDKKLKNPAKSNSKKDKSLPWWVELLFVQIGLPDKFLITILKSNKKLKDFIKNDKKSILTFLFVLTVLAYFYPVVRQSKNKLECQTIAKDYISENKDIIKITRRELRMLSTNFCNGGEEVYEIKNIKR